MSRPRYESEDDRNNEREAFARIEESMQCKIDKVPPMYVVDFLASRDGYGVSWGEYKKRKWTWGDYPTVVLSLKKILAANDLYQATGLRTFLYIEDASGDIRYADIVRTPGSGGPPITPTMGGRTLNTRDQGDIEPVAHFPIKTFGGLK